MIFTDVSTFMTFSGSNVCVFTVLLRNCTSHSMFIASIWLECNCTLPQSVLYQIGIFMYLNIHSTREALKHSIENKELTAT